MDNTPKKLFYEYTEWALSANNSYISCYSSYPLDSKEKKNPILFIGGVHGDEPEGIELAKNTLNWLRNTSDHIPNHWVLIPCINPDGASTNSRTNGNLVDLNRNFPTSNWISSATKKRYFPGKKPNSEPETQSLVTLIKNEQPMLVIHCHSWKPCIVYTGENAADIAEKISLFTDYTANKTIGYDTPGSLGDYGGIDLNIPTICIEAKEGAPLNSIWPKFEQSIKWLFSTIHDELSP